MAKKVIYFICFFIALELVNGAVFQCQDEVIEINCPFGREINITNAFYGTNNNNINNSSNTICSKGSNVTQPLCSMENASFIVAERCNSKRFCRVAVNSTVFGDSCSGKPTYLEVNFTCDNSGCGNYEHRERGVCSCKSFCKSNISCLPTCPYENNCVCNDGYLRDPNTGNCVLAKYCPLKGNPQQNHEEYCECATRQRTCKNPWTFSFFHFGCEPGYACQEGYLRDTLSKTCVLPGECPRPYPRWF